MINRPDNDELGDLVVQPKKLANEHKSLAAVKPVTSSATTTTQSDRSFASSSRLATISKYMLANQRVVKNGLSLPIIFAFSVAIGVSYSIAFVTDRGVEWIPRDLTGDTEWTSTTRTHLAQDPSVLLSELLQPTTIAVDTSVSVNFLTKYGKSNEVNTASTAATFNLTWLDPDFILHNGFTIAGQMAGAFEAYGAWPCAINIAKYPIVAAACKDPATDWFAIQVYNNLVATTSEKASTYTSLDYTPMALMSARLWTAQIPQVIEGGIVVKGYKETTYTERQHYLLKLENGQLALAKVSACDRSTQSNALECDHLENDDIYVRNYAKRDFTPLGKLDKLKMFGPVLALGNYVAAEKTFVMLPATAIVMTNTGYSATTRFSTTFAFRLTIVDNKLKTEYNIPQVASFTEAVGNGFATATAQMVIVCLIVFNAIAHCRATSDMVKAEGQVYGFRNHITMGIIARRLGTYKFVFVQLCVYHALNVGKFFSAVYYGTQKTTDTISFGAEGFLLVIVSSMLLDQVIFLEKYSSTRESLTIVLSSGLYLLLLYLNTTYFLSSTQVQVTELPICAQANSCTIINGYKFYYVGLVVTLIVPVFIVNGPVHHYVCKTRSAAPKNVVQELQLTSFEKYCMGQDARIEFGDYSRASGATPISVVHAAGFTYFGPHLVRIKDFYMVVLCRILPEFIIKTSGLTITVFSMQKGRVVTGQHLVLAVKYKLFRDAKHDSYTPIP